jgi:hypothetical protein
MDVPSFRSLFRAGHLSAISRQLSAISHVWLMVDRQVPIA